MRQLLWLFGPSLAALYDNQSQRCLASTLTANCELQDLTCLTDHLCCPFRGSELHMPGQNSIRAAIGRNSSADVAQDFNSLVMMATAYLRSCKCPRGSLEGACRLSHVFQCCESGVRFMHACYDTGPQRRKKMAMLLAQPGSGPCSDPHLTQGSAHGHRSIRYAIFGPLIEGRKQFLVNVNPMAYIGSAEDARRIRKQEEEREKQKKEFAKRKLAGESNVDGAGLRQFGAGTTDVRLSSSKGACILQIHIEIPNK